ncbi:MAG: hypothetical protein QGH33_18610 [Pirellulaceae bacterium]|nr:hypothetical protein [Pirellulaceae bacterium]
MNRAGRASRDGLEGEGLALFAAGEENLVAGGGVDCGAALGGVDGGAALPAAVPGNDWPLILATLAVSDTEGDGDCPGGYKFAGSGYLVSVAVSVAGVSPTVRVALFVIGNCA